MMRKKIRIDFYFIKAKLPVNSPNVSMLKAIFPDSLFTHNESGEYIFLKELFSFEKQQLISFTCFNNSMKCRFGLQLSIKQQCILSTTPRTGIADSP